MHLLDVRIGHPQLEDEPVQLCLGQGIGPLHLDGVLRGEDEEREDQLIRPLAHRHRMLLHGFQERRLRLRRRTVDLVGQEHVREDGALLELEIPLAGLAFHHHVRPDDVGRHQIGGELDSAEVQVHGFGQAPNEHRLPESGNTLQKHVSAGKERGQHSLDHLLLTDDDLRDLFTNAAEFLTEILHPFLDRHGFSFGASAGGRMSWKYRLM